MSTQPARPFQLAYPDAALHELRHRLTLTRWPDEAPAAPWAYGTSVAWLRDLAGYWLDGYDWRATEASLNRFPQFMLPIDDIELHFLKVEGKGPAPMPLLLSHGWPGSVLEFMKLIPLLTDPAAHGGQPEDAFTVVAPSLPGFGLSFRPNQPRLGCEAIADLFVRLMTEHLGFDRFGAQGGDWGAFISSRIAACYPERLLGLHLNLLALPRDEQVPADASAEEIRYFGELAHFMKEETGYQAIQGTRPQTLAFGLSDSPVGLAAWICEKFRLWSDCDGEPLTVFTRDELLGNISLYWLSGAIGSSFWPYYARAHNPWPIPRDRRIEVPTGYTAFPCEILRPPRSLAEKVYNIQRWTPMARGGHFAALEQPEVLAHDIRAFFRPLRRSTV